MPTTYKFITTIEVSDEDAIYWMDYIRRAEYEKFPEITQADYYIAAKRMLHSGEGLTKITTESGADVGVIIGDKGLGDAE